MLTNRSDIMIGLYSIIILVIFLFYTYKYKYQRTNEQTLFKHLIITNIIMIVIDSMARTDGLEYPYFPIINQIGNYLLYILTPLLPLVFVLYVNYKVHLSNKKLKESIMVLVLMFAVNAVIITILISKGFLYHIDENNIYHRGEYFYISLIYSYALILYAIYYIIKYHHKLERKQYSPLLFFVIPPVLSIIINAIFYGFSYIYSSSTLSILLIFIQSQANEVDLDYMTGLYNRRKLHQHLTERINNVSKEYTFGALMIDLDSFKQINDTYGHLEGDKALVAISKILYEASPKHALVTRYGGDEFAIVLDMRTEKELFDLIDSIEKHIDQYNQTENRPFNLSVTIGYELYNKNKHQTINDFVIALDHFMYYNKDKKKN